MFDWLFGDGGKQRKQEEEQLGALREQRADADVLSQVFNNRISSGNYNNDNVGTIMDAGDSYGQFVKDADTQTADLEKSLKQSRYDYFGNGLLGAILNPIGQTATAGFDLATGQYENNDRDMWSDIGAAGQTALSFLPFAGGLARVGGVAGKMAAGVGRAANSVPGMGAIGAVFNAGETLRQQGSDVDMGDLASSAGIGAAFGAGIPIAGRMGGKFLRNRGAKQVAEKFMTDPRNAKASAQLQEAGGGAVNSLIRDIAGRERNNLAQRYGGLYQNALNSMIPQSTAGKLALGGGAIYGGSRLLGMGAEQDPTQQLAAEFVQMYGREPSEYELQLLTAGGY